MSWLEILNTAEQLSEDRGLQLSTWVDKIRLTDTETTEALTVVQVSPSRVEIEHALPARGWSHYKTFHMHEVVGILQEWCEPLEPLSPKLEGQSYADEVWEDLPQTSKNIFDIVSEAIYTDMRLEVDELRPSLVVADFIADYCDDHADEIIEYVPELVYYDEVFDFVKRCTDEVWHEIHHMPLDLEGDDGFTAAANAALLGMFRERFETFKQELREAI